MSSNASLTLNLPTADRRVQPYTLTYSGPRFEPTGKPSTSRVAYGAAHVVKDPLGPDQGVAAIDWEETLKFREHLWSYGLGIAEAMDTAQRGMGLDYEATKELITRACSAARSSGGAIVCGAGTDQMAAGPAASLNDIAEAYEEQCAHIEAAGGGIVLMASRQLAATARGPEDYAAVYDRVLGQVKGDVIIHWLGEMFDPALAGYWGNSNVNEAMAVCIDVMARHADKVRGVKMSLLNAQYENEMRARLPKGVRMFTGDDFNYPKLILGDGQHDSDALLGIFDPIAPAASAALQALDAGNFEQYNAIFAPTVPLSRKIFEAPTYNYKTGVVFLAYLNGFQQHFRMVGGMESARGIVHLSELYRLADAAGMLLQPKLAARRMRLVLELAGISQ